MDVLLEKLKEYGADMDGTMGRFLGDVDLYKTCFAAFLEDESFPQLGEALLAKEYDHAFDCAHTLKGITGNMGLSPLYQVICSMVEALRRNEYANLQMDYAELVKQLNLLRSYL